MTGFQAFTVNEEREVIAGVPSPAGVVRVYTWGFGLRAFVLRETGSAIVLPLGETTALLHDTASFRIPRGCYAQVPAGSILYGGPAVIIHTPQYDGLAQMGGPCESTGRLRYIDGCSDTLLISPAVKGDPCLNLLHLPPGIAQTAHTHPSDRIGIILRGHGSCRTLDREVELREGMFWYIPAGCVHSFHTTGPDDELRVLAWHPDSDFGPTHDEHPMINRTIVDGTPANDPRHAAIRTP